MRGLHILAWRGLRARPLRTTLTTIGVALGVALLYAGLATDANIGGSVDRAVSAVLGRAELRVTAFGDGHLSVGTLATIRDTPGIDTAAPAVERRIHLGVGTSGAGALAAPVTLVGIDPAAESAVHDLVVASGSLPDGDATAVVSATLARQDGLAVGAPITLQGDHGPLHLRVAGVLADDGPWGAIAGRAVVTDRATVRSVFADGGSTRIDLDLADGVDPAVVVEALETRLVREPYVVASPIDLAAEMEASTGDFAATTALIAAIALFAGAFLICNALSMTVSERIHELGLLRAAGSTRRQLMSYVIAQALAIGTVGAGLGVVLGGVLAGAVAGWLRAVGSVPIEAPVMPVAGALAAMAIGVAVTIAAAVEPARRAGRLTPVEALNARRLPPTSERALLRWLVTIFAVVGALGLIVWPRTAGEAAILRALAVYAVLLLVASAVPFGLPALARAAGAPFIVLSRVEERLARASVLRDRARSALTVGALTIALAMVVALGGVGQHARAAASAWIADVVPGDLVLTSIAPRADVATVDVALGTLAGVVSVSPLATFDLALGGRRIDGAAMVGADLAADGRLSFLAGDRATALDALDRGGAVIVPAGVAGRDGLGLGSSMVVAGADGTQVVLRVVGVVERTLPGRAGDSILIGWPDARRLGVTGADAFAVRFASGASAVDQAALAAAARTRALDPVPLERIQGSISEVLDRVFALFDVLSLVAVVIAALGIVNTLAMSVAERVREIGVLRAAGMTRSQVWRSVVVEAGITGLVGAFCGVVAGVLIGALMVALSGGRWDLAAAVPWLAVVLSTVLGVTLAMLAAAYPARLASRVSIVRAVRYE